jgi:DNA-binding PadR family transcriptional regulator
MAMIDIAILGLLKEHDLHGYELRKRLDELPGSRPTVSFGSLYPALNRLERVGHVKAVTHETSPTPAAPMSGSLAGELAAFRAHREQAPQSRGTRGKKVYGITDKGDQRLHELLVDPDVADDRAFEARVAFCHHLTTSERLALFEARRGELARRRDQLARRTGGADSGVTTYVRSLFERDAAAITADLAWLEGLVTAE